MTDVLDHGYCNLVESWGSDYRIIEAARMSTNKGFQGWGASDVPGDEKLLRYLWVHKHTTPFEMAGLTVEVQAPLMVFREWHRHRTQSYSEQSARYVEMPELFYVPSRDRLMRGGQSKTNTQASGNALDENVALAVSRTIDRQSSDAFETYRGLLRMGLAKELARLVLPVNTYSRMRASANLLNWCRFLTLRLPPNAQWEIRQYANAVKDLLVTAFPRTMELFSEDVKHKQE